MIGRVVNNYEIQSLLGEGGMGAVYLARHPVIGRMAAIKVLRAELTGNQDLVTRFINEARAVNALHHPNLIDIIDVGVMPDGTPYLMMEFLAGESLAARLVRQTVLPLDEAVEVASQIAEALSAVHQEKIVHRDLKPENLFLVPDKGTRQGFRVKILDFGIAKLMGDKSNSPKTQTGTVMGTPAYMSPEQCRGTSDAMDHRSDIYSLGVILFHMVCGRTPFVSEGTGELLAMHIYRPVPSPLSIAPHLPQALVSLILKALEKEPRNRFQTMAELHEALSVVPRGKRSLSQSELLAIGMSPTVSQAAALKTTLSSSPSVTGEGEVSGLRTKGRPWMVVAGLATLVAGATIGGLVLRSKQPPPAPPVAPVPAAVVAAVPSPPPAEPPRVQRPAEVTLAVITDPAGARLFAEGKGGAKDSWLGLTPYSGSFPRSDSPLKLRLEKQGYRTHAQQVSLSEDGTVKVILVKSKAKSSPSRDSDDAREI
jgi:eukaryotic-like serine/threonine-protein kinase